MKRLFLLLLYVCLAASSCSKLELDEVDNVTKSDEDKGVTADSTQTYDGECCRVDELETLPNDTVVALKCFIVGYMPGRTVKNTVFNVEADERSTTNLVVSDYKEEDSYEQCATIQLKANSKAQQQLNLQDNPDKWRALVVLIGTKGKYNYGVGLRDVSTYYLLQQASDVDDNPDKGDEDAPTLPSDTPAFPTLLDEEGEVFEGA